MAFLKGIWGKWQHLLHDDKWKHKIYVVIFESDTPAGKWFDVALIGFIVLSILVVIAESIQGWSAVIGPYLRFFGICLYFLLYRGISVKALLFSPAAQVCFKFFRYY